jgi:hypothetical protein
MAELTRRLQLLLDEEQYHRVAAKARRERTSVAAVIRHAIDRDLDVTVERRKAALRAILDAEPMEVPEDPEDLKREIDEMYDERARRWGL